MNYFRCLRLSAMIVVLGAIAGVMTGTGLMRAAQADHDRVVRTELRLDAVRERVANVEALRIEPRLVRIEEHQEYIEKMLWVLLGSIALLVTEAALRIVRNGIRNA